MFTRFVHRKGIGWVYAFSFSKYLFSCLLLLSKLPFPSKVLPLTRKFFKGEKVVEKEKNVFIISGVVFPLVPAHQTLKAPVFLFLFFLATKYSDTTVYLEVHVSIFIFSNVEESFALLHFMCCIPLRIQHENERSSIFPRPQRQSTFPTYFQPVLQLPTLLSGNSASHKNPEI